MPSLRQTSSAGPLLHRLAERLDLLLSREAASMHDARRAASRSEARLRPAPRYTVNVAGLVTGTAISSSV
jgi:hypothetical protein